jgi:hypothetical protein
MLVRAGSLGSALTQTQEQVNVKASIEAKR